MIPWWLWIGLLAGVVTPWVIMPRSILVGFPEKGVSGGIAVWFGMCWLTVPFMLLVNWIAHFSTETGQASSPLQAFSRHREGRHGMQSGGGGAGSAGKLRGIMLAIGIRFGRQR